MLEPDYEWKTVVYNLQKIIDVEKHYETYYVKISIIVKKFCP